MYSKAIMEHFENPHHAKEIADATVVEESENPVCGDIMKLFLTLRDDRIADVGVKTLGCVAAIAAGSALGDLVLGASLQTARQITHQTISETLGGFPRHKRHAGELAAEVLRTALSQMNTR